MDESKTKTLKEEFNRWAEAGRGEGMERDHLPIALPVLEKMRLAATDNVLDVGCGSGWLARRLAERVPEGRVMGMDVSDEMIRVARRTSLEFENILYAVGEVGGILSEATFFNHAISVESAYYWPEPAAGIREIFRVLRATKSPPMAWVSPLMDLMCMPSSVSHKPLGRLRGWRVASFSSWEIYRHPD